MEKIQYGQKLDSAHLFIDVLRRSHTTTPSRLNYQVLINLYENGVSKSSILRLFDEGLEKLTKPFLDWKDPQLEQNIWLASCRMENVPMARKTREKAWLSRMFGGSALDTDELAENEDSPDELEFHEKSTAWWGDECSGQPSPLSETVGLDIT
jgi:RNA-dependent RNA polymerase